MTRRRRVLGIDTAHALCRINAVSSTPPRSVFDPGTLLGLLTSLSMENLDDLERLSTEVRQLRFELRIAEQHRQQDSRLIARLRRAARAVVNADNDKDQAVAIVGLRMVLNTENA